MTRALLAGEAEGRLRRRPSARPPRRARAGDGLLPLRQHRRRRGAGARRARPRAGLHPRLGRPPRQRHRRDLPPAATTSSSPASTRAGSSPARAPARTPAPARARATRSTVPSRRAATRASGCRCSRTSCSRRRRSSEPQLVLISAGFDAHRDDPLAECQLETASFARMAGLVRAAAADWGAPVGAVLEGGYDLTALADSVVATMAALGEKER